MRPETVIIYDGQHARRGEQALLNRLTEVLAGALDAGYRSIMLQVDEPGDFTQLRRTLHSVHATRHARVLMHSASCLHPDAAVRYLLAQQFGWRVNALTGPGIQDENEPSAEDQQRAWGTVAMIKGTLDSADKLDIGVAIAESAQ